MMDILAAIADEVKKAIDLIPEGSDRGEEICMGADGTPTSQIDKIAENTVLRYIAAKNVPLNVLSEEIGYVDNGAEDILVLDPIDGTRNAALNIPYYTISMAVCRKSMSNATYAYIRNMVTGDEYRAEKGKGAYLNGKRISVKGCYNPNQLTMHLYMGRSADPFTFELAKRIKASRSMGCASLEMCSVAEGAVDGFLMMSENYTHSIRVIDIAASCLILREAGGEVYTMEGEPLDMPLDLDYRSNFLAAASKNVFDCVMNGESSFDDGEKVKYGIYANTNISDVKELAQKVIDCLGDEEYIIDSELAALMGREGIPLNKMDADIVIVLGGDGTLLRATHNTDAKIMGINAGGVGFLTAVERNDIERGIDLLKKGEYTIDRRSKIRVTQNGKVLGDALNEAMVHTDSVAKIRAFRVYVDDSLFTEVKADGFMLSTETGSTSYSMSLGAPIMDPRVSNAWMLSPIAAFKYSSRPMVVPSTAKITIELLMPNKDCLLVIDGQNEIVIEGGSKVELALSPKYGRLISMGADFYDRVREKLVTSL